MTKQFTVHNPSKEKKKPRYINMYLVIPWACAIGAWVTSYGYWIFVKYFGRIIPYESIYILAGVAIVLGIPLLIYIAMGQELK